MQVMSIVTGRCFEENDMVYISNPVQIAKYLENGCVLYHLAAKDGRLTAAFSRTETKPCYDKWKEHTL